MDSAAVNDDVPPPYDGPATTPEYTPSKSPFAGETDAKAHQEELAKEESVFLPARPRRRASLWPSPARILSSALSVCRRALLIWAPPFCQTPPPPPASEDRLEIALADASAKSRMMHLLALLVALICDSEVSATPFSAAQFRELWEEPCIARLQDYQDSGMISPAISEEIDTFCEFMKRVTMVIPACSAEEAERIANMCWTAVNENNFQDLYLPLPAPESHSLSPPNEPANDLLTPSNDEAEPSSLKKLDIEAGETNLSPPHRPRTDSLTHSTGDTKLPSLKKLGAVTGEAIESSKGSKLGPSLSSLPSSSSSQSPPRNAHDHIRSVMSNVLGEFSALITEDNLDLEDFRSRWYEPAVVQILDAMQEGVLQNEDKLRRDASSWLRFLRAAMASLEQDAKSSTKDPFDHYTSEGSRKEILQQRRDVRQRLREHIATKGRNAYFSDDYDTLRS